MTDIHDIIANPPPMGYVDCPEARAAVAASFAAAGVDLSGKPVAGEFKRQIAAGNCYINLHDYEADFIRGQGSALVKGNRNILGGVLQPLSQRTGICNGCSHSCAPWLSWCYRFVNSGDCPIPREVTVLGGYLLGRQGLRGDSGAYPNYTAKGYHDIGVLPVDAGGKYRFDQMTPEEQEDVCIALRDAPSLRPEWVAAMALLKTRVFSIATADLVADCIASGYAVTFGSSMQMNVAPNPGGISSLYQLRDGWGRPAGHETTCSGIATLKGRVMGFKTESWLGANWYPSGNFPSHQITIQTDAGPKTLYPGQGAFWLDDWMNQGTPECWAYSYPGSAT